MRTCKVAAVAPARHRTLKSCKRLRGRILSRAANLIESRIAKVGTRLDRGDTVRRVPASTEAAAGAAHTAVAWAVVIA